MWVVLLLTITGAFPREGLLTINAAWTAVIMTPADYSWVTKAEDLCVLSVFTIHIMYSYHYAPGPTCWDLASLYVPPLNFKRKGTQRYKAQAQYTHSIQLTHSGGRVLRSCCPNHYKPSSALVFIPSSQNRQPLRPPPHLRIRAGAFRHPAGGFSLRQTWISFRNFGLCIQFKTQIWSQFEIWKLK
jgi:hypothetical protein